MLCHRIPYPPHKGDKIRSFHLVRHLAERGWRIHLGMLADDPGDLIHREALRPYCASLAVQRMPWWRRLRSPLGAIRGTSFSVECFRDGSLQDYVDTVLASRPIEAALAVSAPMAEYLRATPGPLPPRMLLDLVDVDSEKWRAYAGRTAWPLNRVYALEARLLGRYERLVSEMFQITLLVTEAESSLFRRIGGAKDKVRTLSNGVDLEYFVPPDPAARVRGRTVFCGAMDYRPNIDAMVWFATAVLPRLRRRLPETTLTIVGANPTPPVRALAALPGVRVTGGVGDVRPYVAEAALSVAPMRLARGVQNKVLEAMAMGKAVLATPQAFEGIEAVAGQDLAVAPDDPEAFAAAALKLLLSPEAAASMGACARRRVEQGYSWSARLAPLENMLG
ncbi:TIGR03087 family PEP-CTERM/XrtA system glycosyltransferase [Solidesulfovibrio sp.]|uniref:TIGR03087 family PEP-CTERM/XrtA system glycosyltransferase n=1 Tax=Solidesulfovibrio sp. TaxID=2910990 RepID=UPI002631A2C3|nr:TIGR03087 family PEP-CTERM/XrtA system glycosyltransferase [Solidesulfovibrio sp.]